MTDTNMIPLDFNNPNTMQLPAHLQGLTNGVNAALLATIGASGNRIGLKGSRFRIVLNGKEEKVYDENYLDVVIVGVVPNISRMYYEGDYDPDAKAAPACFSKDGIAPPSDLPKKQHDTCNGCPQNVKGSKVVNGREMKACSYFQRLIVKLAGDDSNNIYKLDVKSQGLFGDSKPAANKLNIRDYAKSIQNRGFDASQLVTRLSFDTDESVPKLLFQPIGFIGADESVRVRELVGSEEVNKMLEISAATVDLSHEAAADETAAEPVTPAAQPTPAAKPVQQAAPTPPPAAPVQRTFRGVPEKLGVKDASTNPPTYFTAKDYIDDGWTKEQLIEGGYVEEVIPEPVAVATPPKPPAPPKPPTPPAPPKPPAPPQQTATAIESVAIPGRAAPAQQAAPVAPVAATPNTGGPVEVGDDAALKALLGELV